MNMASLQLNVGACSETGYVRYENQDRMSGDLFPVGSVYIVADGMGGYQEGALAAEMTIALLREEIGKIAPDDRVEERLLSAFNRANRVIYDKSHSHGAAVERMGSTAVLLLLSGQIAIIAHVGDSRGYLFRNGLLRRLTTDHTRVQRMVAEGLLSAEAAEHHPDSHILERAIGIRRDVTVDVGDKINIEEGDAFLLCSDGLSGYVTDAEIEAVLNKDAKVQDIPEILVARGLNKGGHDNITVQFIQCGDRQKMAADDLNVSPGDPKATKTMKRMRNLLFLLLALQLFISGWIFLLNLK